VRYAVRPVAGRVPGHMVIGANDVVNPAARHDQGSPSYGLPGLDADRAKSVLVRKRSMAPGFAGIENELFSMPNRMMVLGDAKKTSGEPSTAGKAAAKAGGRGTATVVDKREATSARAASPPRPRKDFTTSQALGRGGLRRWGSGRSPDGASA
jgi:hypothetical protein